VQLPLDILFIMLGIHGIGNKMDKNFFRWFLLSILVTFGVFVLLFHLGFVKGIEDLIGMSLLTGTSIYNIIAFFIEYPMFQRFVSAEADKNPILRVVILLISIGLLIAVSRSIYLMK